MVVPVGDLKGRAAARKLGRSTRYRHWLVSQDRCLYWLRAVTGKQRGPDLTSSTRHLVQTQPSGISNAGTGTGLPPIPPERRAAGRRWPWPRGRFARQGGGGRRDRGAARGP